MCTLDEVEERQALAFMILFVDLLLYTALVIPLSQDAVAKLDIKAGQRQFFNPSLSDDQAYPTLFVHPYYGMFFFDLILV